MGHACLTGNHRGRSPLESILLESLSAASRIAASVFLLFSFIAFVLTLLFNSIVNTANATFIPIHCRIFQNYFLLILH